MTVPEQFQTSPTCVILKSHSLNLLPNYVLTGNIVGVSKQRLAGGAALVSNLKFDVWLTVHCNLVWVRNQLDVTYVLSFISPLQVVQHVSGNHVPIFRS